MTVKLSPAFLNFVRPSDHSRFSPSSADRWLACAAATQLCAKIPEQGSNKYQRAGTEAHTVCEDYAKHVFLDYEKSTELMMATDEQMGDAVRYVEIAQAWADDKERIGEVIYIGFEVAIPVYPKLGNFGTADCLIVGTKGVACIDYKSGTGKSVGPTTPQLKDYLLGVYVHFESPPPQDYQFHALIFQPRESDMPKEHTYTAAEMRDFVPTVLNAIAFAVRLTLFQHELPTLTVFVNWQV